MTADRFRSTVLIIWIVVCCLLLAVTASAITRWRFPDPDDQMRLLQVRDLLAGQSWFDVTQYRLAPPGGVPMHWSRIVDLPIATIILILRPILGQSTAEMAALIVIPLLTMGATLALLATVARRVMDTEPALLAVCLAPMCVEVVHQIRPMRIDHHGWQMVLALVATLALLDVDRRRAGIIAGSALAVWLAISLEGLPMVAAIVTLVTLRWIISPTDASLLRSTVVSATAVSIALALATQPVTAWRAPACDAMSLPYFAALVVATIGMTLATMLPMGSWLSRLVAAGVVGIATLATVPLITPVCAAGPFAQLDPVVRDLWYLRVMEGLPMWRQPPVAAVNSIIIPMLGCIGTIIGWRNAADAIARRRWATLAFLTISATAAACLVQRSSGTAALIALPGVVRLVYPALVCVRRLPNVPLRTLATLALFLLVVPGLAIGPAVALIAPDPGEAAVRKATACLEADNASALRAVPRGVILAPLDISPTILVLTPHSAIASGHHRGHAAMRDVIAAFTGSAETARAIVRRRGVNYVGFCPGLAETVIYEEAAPNGFFAQLDHGQSPTWLTPVPLAGSSLKLWRVN